MNQLTFVTYGLEEPVLLCLPSYLLKAKTNPSIIFKFRLTDS